MRINEVTKSLKFWFTVQPTTYERPEYITEGQLDLETISRKARWKNTGPTYANPSIVLWCNKCSKNFVRLTILVYLKFKTSTCFVYVHVSAARPNVFNILKSIFFSRRFHSGIFRIGKRLSDPMHLTVFGMVKGNYILLKFLCGKTHC